VKYRSLTLAALLLRSLTLAAPPGATQPDPFAAPARARVLLFVRTDCPITNRYAPELQRVAEEFSGRGVRFWLVYPDATETDAGIRAHIEEYRFPGEAVRDPRHELVRRAHATVAPEAAVFDEAGKLIYHGRIDDRYVDIGKARPAARRHDLENAIAAVLAGKPVAESETRAVGCSLADIE
jgi:hypothetical protein